MNAIPPRILLIAQGSPLTPKGRELVELKRQGIPLPYLDLLMFPPVEEARATAEIFCFYHTPSRHILPALPPAITPELVAHIADAHSKEIASETFRNQSSHTLVVTTPELVVITALAVYKAISPVAADESSLHDTIGKHIPGPCQGYEIIINERYEAIEIALLP
jgi:hypothetical protein